MSRVRTLFLGTPEIARFCLENLIRDEHFEVVAVVTQPDRPAGRSLKPTPSPVKKFVEPLGIPCYTPERADSPEFLETLREIGAEVAVVVAFGQILRQSFLDMYPQRVVNLHASLLPRWRGAAPIQRGLMAGDTEAGVSLQIMVQKLDAGPIIGSRKIVLDDAMGAGDVFAKIQPLGVDLIAVDFMDYLRGNLYPVAQDESKVTLAPKIKNEEAEIDWSKSARVVLNLIRGLSLSPVAFTVCEDKRVKVHKASVLEEDGQSGEPGEILSLSPAGIDVACGEGVLRLLKLQLESRVAMGAEEFVKGCAWQKGTKFKVPGRVSGHGAI